MVDIDVIRMSSKGQIVIPADMREEFKIGQKFVVIKTENKLLLEPVDKFNTKLAEDIEFAKRTEAAYKEIERGEGTTMEFDDFIEEIKKW